MDWILRKRVQSLDLPPFLAASVLIMEPYFLTFWWGIILVFVDPNAIKKFQANPLRGH